MLNRLSIGLILFGATCSSGVGAFDAKRATQYAKLAGAVYCGHERKEALEAWDCGPKCIPEVHSVKACNGDTTVSIVGRWDEICVVAFQGSHTLGSYIQDLELGLPRFSWDLAGAGVVVHWGMYKEWQSHGPCVKENLAALNCTKVGMTGHSLGAGVTLLAMVELAKDGWDVAEAYHFGTPRTGNAAFAALHNNMFGTKNWRVTHALDPIPQLPPRDMGYEHVEPEVYFKDTVGEGYETCTDPGDFSKCAEQHWWLPTDMTSQPVTDHLHYMDVDLTDGVDHGCRHGIAWRDMPAPIVA